jgi:hypothetical protein
VRRIDTECVGHHQVDARIGLAQAGLGAFDHVMEQLHDVGLVQRAHRPVLHGREVVGDAACLQTRTDAAQRLDHLGADHAAQQRQHIATVDLMAERAAFDGERRAERLGVDLAALESRPGVLMRIGRIDGAQEAHRQAAFHFEAGERLERAGRDHPAEIPDDCLHCRHAMCS